MNKQKVIDPKAGGEKNFGLAALETTVFNFFNTPEESKYCLCEICLENYELKQKGKEFLKQSSSMFKIDVSRMKKFYQFLSNVDHKIAFRLQMPELCFFQGGEGKVLFKTKANAVIMVQISAELRKQIANFFIDSKKMGSNQHPGFGQNQNNHIKYFQSIIPSFKHGLSNDNLDNRPKNYTFHCDQKQSEDNQIYRIHQNAASQVAIVKYKDKGLELVNEKQLRQILKSNIKTQNIQLIQTYIRPHQKQAEFIFSQYLDYRKPQNVLMFNRSLIQMKTEIGLLSKFSKEYIPLQYLQQYEQMLKQMPEEYCLYQTYKMVHYIQINRDIKIKQLNTVWFKDQYRELTFFGVMQFTYEQNEKVNADVSNILDLKDLMKSEMTDLEKELLNAWQSMKKRKMKGHFPEMNENEDDLREVELIRQESENRRKVSHDFTSLKRKGSSFIS